MISARTLAASATLACTLAFATALPAQQNIQPSQPNAGQVAGAQNWTMDQLLTSTVHQAWLLSGKNEATFFEMVRQLAELPAKNREITLPDTQAAGQRMGQYIKTSAKSDTDQLLYAVVDHAVVLTAHAPKHPAASATK